MGVLHLALRHGWLASLTTCPEVGHRSPHQSARHPLKTVAPHCRWSPAEQVSDPHDPDGEGCLPPSPTTPPGYPNCVLTLPAAFAEAGLEPRPAGVRNTVDNSGLGIDLRWSTAELYAAMEANCG